jgi:hypothetical protein
LAQLPRFGLTGNPPPPVASCATSASVTYIEPWIVLPFFPATAGGGCVSNTGRAGELWTVRPTTVDSAEICIDNTGLDAVPLYATLNHFASTTPAGRGWLEQHRLDYDHFVPGPPPASAFAIPVDCKC